MLCLLVLQKDCRPDTCKHELTTHLRPSLLTFIVFEFTANERLASSVTALISGPMHAHTHSQYQHHASSSGSFFFFAMLVVAGRGPHCPF